MASQSVGSSAQVKRTLSVIWAGMMSSIVCYGAVNYLAVGMAKDRAVPPVFPLLLLAQSLVCYAIAFVWYRRFTGTWTARSSPTKLQQLPGNAHLALCEQLQSRAIIWMALLEAPAIFGLVNTMVGSPLPYLFQWLASASLVGLGLLRLQGFPVLFGLVEALERAQQGPV